MNFEPDKLEIRNAKPEDVLGINTVLYKAWLVTYPNEEFGITKEDIEESYKSVFTEESIKKREEGMRNIPANQKRLVAVYEGQIVGATSMVKNEEYNQLRTIYILPEFQGKGIGSKLYREAVIFCDKSKKLIVQVATYNTNAIRFYEKHGFVDTGKRFTDEQFRFKSGAIIPEMELEIQPGNF
jgi:ribosomal protein S18 acetylase RimI-like enzyme